MLIVFSLPLVNAVPDSVVTGPYKVSFDLGLKSDEYTVNVTDPKITETLGGKKIAEYSVDITSVAGTYYHATISIRDIEEDPQ
jgi:hypothetical protein